LNIVTAHKLREKVDASAMRNVWIKHWQTITTDSCLIILAYNLIA